MTALDCPIDMQCTNPAPQGLDGRYALRMVMQPIMSLSRPHETLNFELLLRATDLDANISIRPDVLVMSAERNGSIGVIDRWVMTTCLDWLEKHGSKLENTQFATLNVSAISFDNPDFHRELMDRLESFSYPNQLCIEITESVALIDFNFARQSIRDLRLRGVRVAIDDFGAGHASFNYLRELSVDAIKIDGALVKAVAQDKRCAHIVKSICGVAHALGMKVVAEWAEDNATVEALKKLGADFVQGYAISKPREAHEILNAGTLGRLLRLTPDTQAKTEVNK